jgi:uncharacterized cupredoxin-like copper-binding protein
MIRRIFTATALAMAVISTSALAHKENGAAQATKPVPAANHHAKDNAQAHAEDTESTRVAEAEKGGHASTLGQPGEASKATRTMEVDMNDNMRFSPSQIKVKRGETIRFVVKNSGKLKHEMVLGSVKELKTHAEMMRKMPEMEHADENMVSVDPGKTGELIWQFSKSGKFDFACLQPGHFEAGMKGKVAVR